MTDAWGHGRPGAAESDTPSPLESGPETSGPPPTWWEVGDVLWLAAHQVATRTATEPPAPPPHLVNGQTDPSSRPADSEPERRASSADREIAAHAESLSHGPHWAISSSSGPSLPSTSTAFDAVAVPEPAGWSVGDPQGLLRAAGGLRRYRAAGRHQLDERATAEGFAARILANPHPERVPFTPLIPEFAPSYEPADDLILLIDDSLSMRLQRPVVSALSELLAPVGVFRRVRTFMFDSDKALADDIELRGAMGVSQDPHRLCAGSGHEIVLVLTDGIGDGWYTGALGAWLAYWGRHGAVGIGQLLDRSRWARTGIRPRPVVLETLHASAERLIPNTGYRARPHGLASPDIAFDDAVAVPVFPLDARELGRWARFVAHPPGVGGFVATALLAQSEPRFPDDSEAAGVADSRASTAMTAEDRVADFRASAPPSAFHLAVCLAAVPLTMPVVRLVKERFAPRAHAADLTEVLCSGLVRRRDGNDDLDGSGQVPFDFHPGVRELLLAMGGRRQEVQKLVDAIATRYRDSIPWLGAVQRLLLGQDSEVPLPAVDAATAPFADAIGPALRALPGPIRAAATRWRPPQHHRYPGEGPSHDPRRVSINDASHDRADVAPNHTAPDRTAHTAHTVHTTTKDSDMAPGDTATGSSERTFADQQPASGPGMEEPPDGPEVPGRRSRPSAPTRLTHGRPAVWGQIPARNVNFVGRAELLEDLWARLRQDAAMAVLPETPTHALQGMGGVGKTQLVLEYAWRHRSEYELVWWIPAETPAQVQQSLIELARKLDIGSRDDPALTVRAVLDALASGDPYTEWLLIYDNATEPGTLRSLMPSAGPGQVLLTSRSPEWRTAGSNLLRVDTFRRDESRELLLKRGPESLTASDADLIAEKLGDLPLAVAQTSVWLYETMMPPSEWLNLFDEKSHELLSNVEPGFDYPRSVAATMEMTLDRLRETNRGALQLLQVCAFLAPQPIPRRLFNGTRNVEAPAELGEILADPAIKLSRALRTIDRYALIKMDHRNETFQLHRLVQETLKLSLGPEERRELRHCAHQLLANLDPGDAFSYHDWSRYVELLPHVWATELWQCRSPWVRQLVIGEMHFLALWGGYPEGEALGARAIADWRERLGSEDVQTLRAEARYVQLLRTLGSFQEALDRNRQLVDTLTQTRGADDEETLEARLNLAWDLRNVGRWQEAVHVSSEVFELYIRRFGRDDVLTLHAGHLQAIGLRLTGRFAEALEIDLYNFERRIEILGPEHGRTQGSKYGYALGMMESGRYWESMGELEEQHELDNRLYAPHAPSRLITMMALSTVKRRTGDLAEAVALSEEAYRLSVEGLGADNLHTALAAAGHSVSLRAVGQYEEALVLSAQARQHLHELYGAHHPLYADESVNHAVILRLVGQVEQAREIDEEALSLHVDALGQDHPSTIANAVNLASDLFALGDATAALEMDAVTHERANRAFGADHPLTLAVRRNLALDRKTVERTSLEAERADIVASYRAVFGVDHPATLAAGRDVRANCDLFLNTM